jgi:putative PEP-CTERM system histidine kinase
LGRGDELVPGWLLEADKAWAGVPLVRGESLIGVIVLGRPAIGRMLDWEDFDLLKVIGQQVAMHLADAQNQAELEQARQFDEFNRRFAFIIHDIKNVVSQLSLVVSNAAEHGANPRFQESMARTLASATAKMTVLLSRLSADGPTSPTLDRVDLGRLLTELADTRQGQHPITLAIEHECRVGADAEQLRQAIDHLIQNAIEASPAQAPIELTLATKQENALISIKDRGSGMAPEFVRKQLFKPFASTKPGGFGIGAAEAKALIEAMGGGLDVKSVEGAGTQFSIRLPLLPPPRPEPGTPQAAGVA